MNFSISGWELQVESMNIYYYCKQPAAYLRNKGIEIEIIDLLQGRISSSVFWNHYYRPDFNEIITKRIRPVLELLYRINLLIISLFLSCSAPPFWAARHLLWVRMNITTYRILLNGIRYPNFLKLTFFQKNSK